MGKAILVTETTGASELFTDGIDALVVPCNKESVASGLSRLYTEPTLRNQLGSQARKLIAAQFQEQDIVQSRLAVYETILNSGRQQKPELEENLQFLADYLTKNREIFYGARKVVKKWYYGLFGKKLLQ